MSNPVDLFVVGGGVNGCGIARDAAGRGLSVVLCEQNDLASSTSSASTKLFHGGLRYLEHYEFSLVKHALAEREHLLSAMPHISWPLRFVLPHHKALRPAWLLRVGLFIYDHLGGRTSLPGTRTLNLAKHVVGEPLNDSFKLGFEYSDCWVQDSRLVVLNARDAMDRGARILTRTKLVSASVRNGLWELVTENTETGETSTATARALVNAGGPWVRKLLDNVIPRESPFDVRLVRGSHIVVPKMYDHDRAYIFQQPDGRIIFALPYEHDYTLIGTTDVDHKEPLEGVKCSSEERTYLCNAASAYFRTQVRPEDVVWDYAGIRPLVADGSSSASATTRDYVLEYTGDDGAPLLNVWGGKITTYRRLAEEALEKMRPAFPDMPGAWTRGVHLAGGNFPVHLRQKKVAELRLRFPFLDERHAEEIFSRYGMESPEVLGDARSLADLGERFGPYLHACDVRWQMAKEFARTAEDVAWRRTRKGIGMTRNDINRLDAWMRAARDRNVPAFDPSSTGRVAYAKRRIV